MNVGIAIKKVRREKFPKMSQIDFASLVRISQTYLSQIESGKKTPKIEILERISIKLNIPLAVFFWFGIEESDISDHKKESFKMLKPTIDTMINEIF